MLGLGLGLNKSGSYSSGTYSNLFIVATGGIITTDGNYKIHTFNSSDNFVVSSLGDRGGLLDRVLLVGGGGGSSQGGGGGGGVRELVNYPVNIQSYPVIIGGGGVGANGASYPQGSNGSPTIFDGYSAAGGGGGGGLNALSSGLVGGCGGGGGIVDDVYPFLAYGAAGNNPSTSPTQGYNGANSAPENISGGFYISGGGGGAGDNAITSDGFSTAADGGVGYLSSITGIPTYYGGGGGGQGGAGTTRGAGGLGGGGIGENSDGFGSGPYAEPGTVNTGGGAGAISGYTTNGFSGGSGIVIIRYRYK